jgi:hypothetical protein
MELELTNPFASTHQAQSYPEVSTQRSRYQASFEQEYFINGSKPPKKPKCVSFQDTRRARNWEGVNSKRMFLSSLAVREGKYGEERVRKTISSFNT